MLNLFKEQKRLTLITFHLVSINYITCTRSKISYSIVYKYMLQNAKGLLHTYTSTIGTHRPLLGSKRQGVPID